ncbi:hypothetical protein [Undibacterium sp.]|uniref:hypothetical protein n=1 Tax=Undibacterium sp. TaxID=1914977 RepID=UPI00374D7974
MLKSAKRENFLKENSANPELPRCNIVKKFTIMGSNKSKISGMFTVQAALCKNIAQYLTAAVAA